MPGGFWIIQLLRAGKDLNDEIYLWTGSFKAAWQLFGGEPDTQKDLQLFLHLLSVGKDGSDDQRTPDVLPRTRDSG